MEHQAACEFGGFAGFAVDGIADEWGSFVMHVDADLVGAAGVEMAEHECCDGGGVGGEGFVIGDRGFAARRIDDRHFLAVYGVSADVGEDGFLFRFRDALSDGEVKFLHRAAFGKLGDERLVGYVRFGDDEATGRVFIESVDDAWTLNAADAGKFSAAMMEQGVDESAVRVSGCGMNDHARGFVEHDEIVVFKQDIEWDVLRGGIERHGFGNRDGDQIADFYGIAGFGGLAVDDDELVADQRLDARAREVLQTGCKEGVKAFAGGIYTNFHVWILSAENDAASFKFVSVP